MTRPARAQVNAQTCAVAYDTGETEELPVDDVIRDGIMSLGWQRARPTSGASSGRCFSGSGAFHSSLDGALIETLFQGLLKEPGLAARAAHQRRQLRPLLLGLWCSLQPWEPVAHVAG